MSSIEGVPKRHIPEVEKHKDVMLDEARALVREPYCGYDNILRELEEKQFLSKAVDSVQRKYGGMLSEGSDTGKNIKMTSENWEMLAVLWLFDEETTKHSIETYRIARDKVTKPLLGEVVLADEFTKEGVSLEQFFRACIFHDIGKIAVPRALLTDKNSDVECAAILLAHPEDMLFACENRGVTFASRVLEHITPEGLVTLLHDTYGLRPSAVLPVRLLLRLGQEPDINEELLKQGLTLDSTLIDVMNIHEKSSQDILELVSMSVEARLVGSHHNHNSENPYTITIGTLQLTVDISDIIHLADVEQAVGSARYYKRPESALSVMETLVWHAERGFVHKEITYLWIADEISKIDDIVLKHARTGKDAPALAHILDFLTKEHKEIKVRGSIFTDIHDAT